MKTIYPPNPQWNLVNFKLQLALGLPSIQVQNIISYSHQFDPAYRYHLKIDALIDATSYLQQNLEQLRNRLTNNYIFESGYIPINDDKNRKLRKMLFFKLAVGETLPIHKSGINELKEIEQFPPNYDTIYMTDSKQQLNKNPHKYKLKDKNQYALEYEVDYVINDVRTIKKWEPSTIKCEYCNKRKAQHYCEEDRQLFCGECYLQMHRSSKKKSHSKTPINPYNSTSICPFHSDERITYYCFDCKELRCFKCVENPVHKNENKHQYILLKELVSAFKEKQESFLNEAKNKTQDLLKKVQNKIQGIKKNYEQKQKQLQTIFSSKLSKLREDSNQQIMKIMGLHAELKRKYDEFLWVQNYMDYWENSLLADDSVKMKESFSKYLQEITVKEYYQKVERTINPQL